MPTLIERLQTTTGDELLAAIRDAATTSDPDIASALIQSLQSPALGEPVRQAAAESLATSGLPVIAKLLLPLRCSPEPFLRTISALALGGQTGPAAIISLVEGLGDPVNTVRNWSERSLVAQIPAVREHGVPSLLGLLAHTVPLSRSPAARVLGLTRDSRSLEPLMLMAQNDSEWLPRMWAIQGLGELSLAPALPVVVDRLVHDPKNRVRAAAAEALGKLRPENAEALLRTTLDTDNDDGVLKSAGEALRSLGFEVAEINDDGWE